MFCGVLSRVKFFVARLNKVSLDSLRRDFNETGLDQGANLGGWRSAFDVEFQVAPFDLSENIVFGHSENKGSNQVAWFEGVFVDLVHAVNGE